VHISHDAAHNVRHEQVHTVGTKYHSAKLTYIWGRANNSNVRYCNKRKDKKEST
jgi:hypothetical protein